LRWVVYEVKRVAALLLSRASLASLTPQPPMAGKDTSSRPTMGCSNALGGAPAPHAPLGPCCCGHGLGKPTCLAQHGPCCWCLAPPSTSHTHTTYSTPAREVTCGWLMATHRHLSEASLAEFWEIRVAGSMVTWETALVVQSCPLWWCRFARRCTTGPRASCADPHAPQQSSGAPPAPPLAPARRERRLAHTCTGARRASPKHAH
jgi:hypothetical protein